MSFAAPLWLLALALIPLALVAYVLRRRRAQRYAIRFPAVATVQRLAGAGGRWSRQLPALFLLAAIAALALALARPRVTEADQVASGSVILVLDHSGSMAATDVQPTRLAAAQHAADGFVAHMPAHVKVGVIGFGFSPDIVQAPVFDHAAALSAIASQTADGSTATGDALALALQLLKGSDPKHPPSAIVLLSDGAANAGQNVITVAGEARRDRIPIYTVALGTPNGVLMNPFGFPQPVPPDPELMAQIAQTSGARAFDAQTAGELDSIYQHLGTQLATVKRRHYVTAEFALGGLVLLLIAAAGSTLLSGRLP